MPTFPSHDGTTLTCRRAGQGRSLVCLPGVPAQSSRHLGGLSASRTLLLLDSRGSGDSAAVDELTGVLPKAELVMLPRSSHVPFVDEPEAYAAAVERFPAG
ncbi:MULTISPECIES: hypothetical protein [unclassified Micromonospora]|uniref:alpha/beta fold hydrolase n=1 Tax=unclassified Micromonospora TaxID=2617518 RepID=UPI003320C9DD